MNRDCIKIRLLRAATGWTQEDFSGKMGTHASTLAQWELGLHAPSSRQVERAAEAARLSLGWCDEVLQLIESHREQRQRPGQATDDLFSEFEANSEAAAHHLSRRLLSLELRPTQPREQDRLHAGTQLKKLLRLTPAQRAAVIRLGRDYHAWALCIEAGEESIEAASKNVTEAGLLVKAAVEIASLVEGSEGWPDAVKSHAVAYQGNLLRFSGKLKEARAAFEEVKLLGKAGSDPYGVLDPGRLLELEASLYRAERKFNPALDLLDQAVRIGRSPARSLINKGCALETMGDYKQAVLALRTAESHLQVNEDTRLLYMLRFNLAVNLTYLLEFEEASQHLQDVRRLATERGDEIELIRVTWLEGRLLAGLGRRSAARFYLKQAMIQFETKKLWYDAALARLELAGLLLDEGRTAEVKTLTAALPEAFEAEGVYVEALKAVRLFQEAVEHEQATAELARRVLSFLFRSRHDPELRFAS